MEQSSTPTAVGSNAELGPKLERCPFCGSDAYLSGEMLSWRVFCHGCNAMNGPYPTEAKALFWWNRRVGGVPMDPLDIEEMFDAASDADDEVHVRFARMIEKHHGIGA